jgi:small subunit ribosomal protein S3Ae
LFKILLKEEIGKQIQKECSRIFPLQDNCMIRKVKLLKKPKFDLTKLLELYKDKPEAEKPTEVPANAIAQ